MQLTDKKKNSDGEKMQENDHVIIVDDEDDGKNATATTPVKAKKSKKKHDHKIKNIDVADTTTTTPTITKTKDPDTNDIRTAGESGKKKSKKRKNEETENNNIENEKIRTGEVENGEPKTKKAKNSKSSVNNVENGDGENKGIEKIGDNESNELNEKTKKKKKRTKSEEINRKVEECSEKLPKSKKENSSENDKTVKKTSVNVKKFVEEQKQETKNHDEKDDDDESDDDDNDLGSFKRYSLSSFVVEKLKEQGIKKLFPVQYESFNDIMSGADVILQSRTGSGKTFSFAIPLIEMLHASQLQADPSARLSGRAPQVLVLAPTRELTKQVADSISSISNDMVSVLCVYGGTPVYPQERALQNGVDILVGTPGRIQDLIDRGVCDLSSLKHVVLDEVDRMLDMGFADDVDRILQYRYCSDGSRENPQTLFFSATLPSWVQQTASKYLNNAVKRINLIGHGDNKTSKTVQHLAIRCSYQDRAATINSVVRVYSGNQGRAMIFCKTKKDADELALSSELTVDAHVIHGDVPQEKREMVLKCFRDGKYRCLIATDVAARGLDIPEVDLVIQCSPPKDVESYIHRSGRTGRAGRQGTCVLFFKREEERELRMVEQRANIKLKIVGPPTPADIMRAAAEDAARVMASVSKEASNQFADLAQRLIDERGAVTSLSEALAIISGNQEIKQRSLLSSREGMVTFLYRTSGEEIRYMSYVWNALGKCINQDMKEAINGMRFCKDRMGVAFDIAADKASQLESLWVDGKHDTLKRTETLPELEQAPDYGNRGSHGRGWGRFGSGAGRGRGGYRMDRGGGEGGRNFSGGWKRYN
ncbi:hypothetical protein HELRODRAFT_190040 [Helobdella robusta]|uniref:RNA helicase n=1 Tax=Helobdella robusta TaxID=6412 RepID=T1FRM2_HELRO|nr:hypothetical protein HELRODRAFT_190040 [Helobdella robusta]ESO11642.1 hypothetical protein HELRODRAFT_190040 [Helobdella robusta]